jgi:hypothetical protein
MVYFTLSNVNSTLILFRVDTLKFTVRMTNDAIQPSLAGMCSESWKFTAPSALYR